MLSKPPSLDHLNPKMSLIMADGVTSTTIYPSDIDEWNIYNVRSSISYGIQAGALGVMFIMTAALTRSTRRRTPVHILNLLSLFFGFFRGLLQALYFTSDWDTFYVNFAQDFSQVSSGNYVLSIISIIIPLLFAITVTGSLILQAYTVTKLVTQKLHILTTFISISILLVAIAFRFANAILNCKAVMNSRSYFDYDWLQLAVMVTETITIWFFSIIFTGKLVYTMWTRKNLGLDSWSHMQILSVMSTCTMIIPSIFALIRYIDIPSFPTIDTWPLTVVALLLPLSALWASMIVTEATSSLEISKAWRDQSQTLCMKCSCELVGNFNSDDSNYASDWKNDNKSNLLKTGNPVLLVTENSRRSLDSDLRKASTQTNQNYSIQNEKIL